MNYNAILLEYYQTLILFGMGIAFLIYHHLKTKQIPTHHNQHYFDKQLRKITSKRGYTYVLSITIHGNVRPLTHKRINESINTMMRKCDVVAQTKKREFGIILTGVDHDVLAIEITKRKQKMLQHAHHPTHIEVQLMKCDSRTEVSNLMCLDTI